MLFNSICDVGSKAANFLNFVVDVSRALPG